MKRSILFILLTLSILWATRMEVRAVTVEDYYKEVLKFDDQGNLLMTTHDRKATTAVTYGTLGWTIKRYDLPADHPDNQCARIRLEDNLPPRDDPEDFRYIYAYFYCDKDVIYNSIYATSPEWAREWMSQGGTVYLDGIMTVYQAGQPQGWLAEDANSWSGEVYFTYEEIAGARPWKDTSGLRTHFDKSLSFGGNPEYQDTDEEEVRIDYYNCDENGTQAGGGIRIGAGERGSEPFDVTLGIPTGEPLYVAGEISKLWYQCTYRHFFGTRRGKTYSYWTVEDLKLYSVTGIRVGNYAFDGEEVSVTVAYNPGVVLEQYGDAAEHLNSGDDQISVRNDYLEIDGHVLLDNNWQVGQTPEPDRLTEEERIPVYERGFLIPDTKQNGKEFPSTAIGIYQRYQTEEEATVSISEVNPVTIHTPVVCRGQVSDERRWNQKIKPDVSRASLILGRAFTVKIGTEGMHREIPGYGQRDYLKYTDGYQVRCPFEVYVGDTYYAAGSWIECPDGTLELYLPTGVKEGNYELEYRSRANNWKALGKEDGFYEERANLDVGNYGAYNRVKVTVIGRLYGFQIIDVVDYPSWKPVFREKDGYTPTGAAYSVGLSDENGNPVRTDIRSAVPIIGGSHPYDEKFQALKTGYHVKFRLKSVGNYSGLNDSIGIVPSFYYIGRDGKGRQEVDLYYNETIGGSRKVLVKAGGALDRSNGKQIDMLDFYSLAPREALARTAALLGTSVPEIFGQPATIYSVGNVRLPAQTRVFTGSVQRNVMNSKTAEKSVQEWYGEYALPAEVYAVPKGFDLEGYVRKNSRVEKDSELFFRDGYLIVNFQVETFRGRNQELSYVNPLNQKNGYCNMWKAEGFPYNRKSNQGVQFIFQDGDALFYDLSESVQDDYRSMGTH